MDFIGQLSRHYRRPYERSISERKFEDHRYPDEFLKGHLESRRENTENSYQDSSRFGKTEGVECAKDLRIIQNGCAVRVKEEIQGLPPPPTQRRYFCIFCKMDFLDPAEFLDHLERHPNGSFVLVKRDQPQPIPAPPLEPEEPEPPTHSPISPEMLSNQIKIEPISEDDEEEEDDFRYSGEVGGEEASPTETSETSDPNHQLMVLSSPRLGDGPGEYLCNVCNAKFVYKNNLKSHLKRHLGIYPYVCFYPSCGKRYQFKCKLNKHIEQAHAKIKNFQCPVPSCPKKYFTRNDLAFHISVTHQERQEIPCHICNKVFNSQKSLQIHCRKYHRNPATES